MTTRKDLDQAANVISSMLGRKYFVQYAYGKPRLHMETAKGGCDDISPRLPAGQLLQWMDAFIGGIEAGRS